MLGESGYLVRTQITLLPEVVVGPTCSVRWLPRRGTGTGPSQLAVDPVPLMPIISQVWTLLSKHYANHQAAPLEAISLRARSEGIRVDTVLHDDAAHFESMTWIASQSEVCLVFVSVFLVEAWDRKELRLDHDGEEMIKTVEKSCAGQVVVVLHVGGQVIIEDWVSHQIDLC
jgi:hypothetical protein